MLTVNYSERFSAVAVIFTFCISETKKKKKNKFYYFYFDDDDNNDDKSSAYKLL